MIVLIISSIMFLVGLVLIFFISDGEALGALLSIIGGITLIITLICGLTSYADSKAEIQRYYAIKQTIENSRDNSTSEVERAAVTKGIAEYNAKLASLKYWNDTTFDIFISDELVNLPYLK